MNKFFSFTVAALLCTSALPALAQSTAATKPTCAAGDPVVWENTSSKSKVYHLEGDKFFGTTKHGAYACKSAADSAGYHASRKSGGAMSSGAMSSGAASSAAAGAGSGAAPSAMASPMGKHHHHHGSAMASPAPDGAAPDAMASPMGKHHHHRHGSAMASPAPGGPMMASPAPGSTTSPSP